LKLPDVLTELKERRWSIIEGRALEISLRQVNNDDDSEEEIKMKKDEDDLQQ
jgi:hypothetical protein